MDIEWNIYFICVKCHFIDRCIIVLFLNPWATYIRSPNMFHVMLQMRIYHPLWCCLYIFGPYFVPCSKNMPWFFTIQICLHIFMWRYISPWDLFFFLLDILCIRHTIVYFIFSSFFGCDHIFILGWQTLKQSHDTSILTLVLRVRYLMQKVE